MTRAFALAILFAAVCAAGVELSIGHGVRDETCSVTGARSTFRTSDPGVFVRIGVARLRARDRVVVSWTGPSGQVVDETIYDNLPAASKPCLLGHLSIAGYAPARSPGSWTVRVSINGAIAGERTFRIMDQAQEPATTINSVAPRTEGSQMRLDLDGSGFRPDSVVHIARFTEAGGWQYLASELPFEVTGEHCAVRIRVLEPGEYVAVIRESSGAVSLPARFVLATGRSYRMPVPDGETWVITQGPNGAFSHWNRSMHAWDIAPRNGRYVVAMRAGIVHTHDLGLGRTPAVRSFGNYITIDHGDGEYSHYAHLATRTFLVRDGERVEAGERLAVVGNSGYTLGGGGYHVHVHVTRQPAISAQSIPFRFDEERAVAATPGAAPVSYSVAVAQWWTGVVNVPSRSSRLRVRVELEKPDTAVNLHLVSPSRLQFGPVPDEVLVDRPEPGSWRIAVEGIRSGPGPIAFRVDRDIESQKKGRPSSLPHTNRELKPRSRIGISRQPATCAGCSRRPD